MERARKGTEGGLSGLFTCCHFVVLHQIAWQRFTPQFLLMRLRHATTAQDDQSEALASTFVQSSAADPSPGNQSSKEIDDFVKEFKGMRKTYHKRVMWGDRWAAGQVTWRDD
jgi:hypothetical protein